MGRKAEWWYKQSGVIAYRLNERKASETETQSQLEVLLITSRKRKRWIIPKGIIESEMSPQESAAKEAFEEAGIMGRASEHSIGVYTYSKWEGTCTVEVFPFEVTTVFDEWPERHIRDREWMSIEEAARRVQEEQLKDLLKKLPDALF